MKYILFIFLLFISLDLMCQRIQTHVKRVIDGDTFICFYSGANHTCRIAFIDAPERNQHFGMQSYNELCRLIYGRKIFINLVGVDLYKRVIVNVSLASRRLDSMLIESGHAWYYNQYANDPSLSASMTRAVNCGLGLWACGTQNVCPPWLFRSYDYRNRYRYCRGC